MLSSASKSLGKFAAGPVKDTFIVYNLVSDGISLSPDSVPLVSRTALRGEPEDKNIPTDAPAFATIGINVGSDASLGTKILNVST
jgi:hypothetical protein